jgi:hypothetical protein
MQLVSAACEAAESRNGFEYPQWIQRWNGFGHDLS